MKLTCNGRNRKVYSHLVFDGKLDIGAPIPKKDIASMRYDTEKNCSVIRFFDSGIHLQGDYDFYLYLQNDEFFDILKKMSVGKKNRSAVFLIIAALQMILNDENETGSAPAT